MADIVMADNRNAWCLNDTIKENRESECKCCKKMKWELKKLWKT
jgi:hypothetical protein